MRYTHKFWASLIAQLVRICLQCRRSWFDSWVGKIPWRRDWLPTAVFLGFPCGSAGKEYACNAGDLGSIPGLGRSPGEMKGYPLQCSGLENSMNFYRLRGHKELDLSEQLSRFTFTRKLPCQAPETEWLSYYQLLLLPKPISPFSKWGTVDKLWFASVWMSTHHALLWKLASTNSDGFLDTKMSPWQFSERKMKGSVLCLTSCKVKRLAVLFLKIFQFLLLRGMTLPFLGWRKISLPTQ